MFRDKSCSFSWGESDFSSFNVKVGVISFDETVSQDEGFSELRWKVKSDQSDDTLGLSEGGDLKDVVSGFQNIFIASESHFKVGVGVDLVAVNLFLLSWPESGSHFGDNSFRSGND